MPKTTIKEILSEHCLKNIKPYIKHSRTPFFQIAKNYVENDSVILDIGSGDGSFAKHLKRNDVYMLDGNTETVELLEKEYENVFMANYQNYRLKIINLI